MNKISENISIIESLFMQTEEFVTSENTMDKLHNYLKNVPNDFKSIAYESASMAIAYIDLKKHNSLAIWDEFYLSPKVDHSFHMQIGLGWAYGKADIWPERTANAYSENQLDLMYDGIGYFYGLYRGRKTLKNAVVPNDINPEYIKYFDKGLGRRLWYVCKGDAVLLQKFIQLFPENRLKCIWQGIGTAVAYVGGVNHKTIEKMNDIMRPYNEQFHKGVKLALLARKNSDTVTIDTENTSQCVFHLSCNDVLK